MTDPIKLDNLLDVTDRMQQLLQDFADDGEQAGNPLNDVLEVMQEYELAKRGVSDEGWINQLASNDDDLPPFLKLQGD